MTWLYSQRNIVLKNCVYTFLNYEKNSANVLRYDFMLNWVIPYLQINLHFLESNTWHHIRCITIEEILSNLIHRQLKIMQKSARNNIVLRSKFILKDVDFSSFSIYCTFFQILAQCGVFLVRRERVRKLNLCRMNSIKRG